MIKKSLKTVGKIIKGSIKVLFVILLFVCFFVAQALKLGTDWALVNYSFSSFDEILYTLGTSVTAASEGVLKDFFESNIYPPLTISLISLSVFILIYIFYKNFFKNSSVFLNLNLFKKKFSIKLNILLLVIVGFLCVVGVMLKNSVVYAMDSLYINEYIESNMQTSTFFEDEYVNPDEVDLEFPDEKRNLIYIFLESMEATYSDKDHGGAYDYNYIPELTDLAEDNINFSPNDDVGGAYMVTGTTWTMGGMIAETAGVPIKNVFGANDERSYENGFVHGAVSLGDILKDEGYRQYIMVGSDLEFGGRLAYFTEHGDYEVYDYNRAIEDGVIDEDYYVWWGLEDEKLFDWARDELTDIADSDEPFNFTMLTVDTHASDGYTSDFCPNYSRDPYLNSIYCSDMQLAEFISWIQNQDFYENTTIVLTGDHISMNNYSFDNIDEDYDRGVYNAYINSAVETDHNKNRKFTTFDYYPTTLASLGVRIKGNRLGLGTNLFSDCETLSEKYGNDYINEEMGKRSTYYDQCINFGRCN